jgi:sugar lactone lactonase YvrE
VYSYDLSTWYDLSTASYHQKFDVFGQDRGPTGVAFNGDGTKMFVVGSENDHVYSYALSEGDDLSTASYNQKFDVSGQDDGLTGVAFNGDGTKMFVVGSANDDVYRYSTTEEQ